MKYTRKYFDPARWGTDKTKALGGWLLDDGESVAFRAGPKPQDVYVYTPSAMLAVNIALATGRPLLVSGEPGCGKSMLAHNVAAVLGWWYYKQMITSRIQAADMLWTFDALRRLNDANVPAKPLHDDQYYVNPGRLWWALNPGRALHRGLRDIPEESSRATDPGVCPRDIDGRPTEDKAVILLDEIDKADPDVPNDLLEALDLKRFTVRETNDDIESTRDVLLVLTTNGERELPPAFMRRCVSITLKAPTLAWFVGIADSKFGVDALHLQVAEEVMKHRAAATKIGVREPSTGEFLDALAVCRHLGLTPDSDAWREVAMSVLWKHEKIPDLEAGTERD